MARGTQLGQLLDMLRHEAGISSEPGHNVGARDKQIQHLVTSQQRLWADYYWPHLRVDRFVTLQAGQRYYTVPTGLTLEGIRFVSVRWQERWGNPLRSPITDADIDLYDPQRADQRYDPPSAWQIAQDDSGDNVIEIWPTPATTGTGGDGDDLQVRVRGQKALPPLVNVADTAVLDDYMIVLFAAAKLVPEKQRKDKLEEAQAHTVRLRADLQKATRFTIGGHVRADGRGWPQGPKPVAYRII